MTWEKVFAWLQEKKHWIFISAGGVIFGIYYLYGESEDSTSDYSSFSGDVEEEMLVTDEEYSVETEEREENLVMMVDVKGAVEKPGVYPVFEGERVIDVLERAGLQAEADDSKINLSQKVYDEMIIYVPHKGEELDQSFLEFSGSGSPASEANRKVNINTADSNELQSLPGIGPAKAQAIIEYRESSGPFQKIEDIMNVSGIGEKSFEKLKDHISVN